MKKKAEVREAEPSTGGTAWSQFWRCQRSPVLRSQVMAALLFGTVIEVERLPRALLADVAVLSTITREVYEAEIVDDYVALLRRVQEVWSEPTWTCRVFDSAYLNWLSWVAMGVVNTDLPELQWLIGWVGQVLDSDPPEEYLAQERRKERKRAA